MYMDMWTEYIVIPFTLFVLILKHAKVFNWS